SLALEIEDDVGEGVALENVLVDFECTGSDVGSVSMHLKRIMSRLAPRGKVSCPEDPIGPSVDFSRWFNGCLKDSLAGVNVNKCKLLRMIVAGSGDDGLLLRLRFVSDLIDKHVNLA